jgi:hypothetical protein
MTPFARSIVAAALIATAAPAAGYVRETTTPGHPNTGLCLWWRGRAVTYRVNATRASPTPCQSATKGEAAAVQGLAIWAGATRTGETSACTDFQFVHGSSTDLTRVGHDGVNLVVFRSAQCNDVVGLDPCAATPGACAAKFNCWEHEVGTIGLTTTTFDSATGEILDADMELNGWDGAYPAVGSLFTCEAPSAPKCSDPPYGQTGCSAVDVTAVVTHEAGHMLGLDHVCSNAFPAPYDACPAGDPVMVPQVGLVSQRALSADDVNGVCTIYPVGGETPTCLPDGKIPSSSSTSSGGGCAAGGGTGVAGGLLAAVLLAGRGRRRER